MQTTNLGDSGFLILRAIDVNGEKKYEKVYKSVDTQHYFNAPYQLSIVPKDMQRGTAKSLGDAPSDSTQTSHQLENGDILIFATDGLWDNLFVEDICRFVTMSMQHLVRHLDELQQTSVGYSQSDTRSRQMMQQAAMRYALRHLSSDLATQAKKASLLRFQPSPFSRGALGANRYHLGG